jgi:hypothetical protein
MQVIGKNIEAEVQGEFVVIRVKKDTILGPSSTGKTNLVANSGGFAAIPGTNLKLSMNVSAPKS